MCHYSSWPDGCPIITQEYEHGYQNTSPGSVFVEFTPSAYQSWDNDNDPLYLVIRVEESATDDFAGSMNNYNPQNHVITINSIEHQYDLYDCAGVVNGNNR